MSKIIKVPVSELSGRALDWAVAVALGKNPRMRLSEPVAVSEACAGMELPIGSYSTSWNDCYAVISEHIGKLSRMDGGAWMACARGSQRISCGPTMEVAACRALVRLKAGDMVDVPGRLVKKLDSLPVGVES